MRDRGYDRRRGPAITPKRVMGAGVVVAAAIWGPALVDKIRDLQCLYDDRNPLDCINFDGGKQEDATSEYGNFSVMGEDLTDTVAVRTFGEVTMQIMVERSTFDYDSDSLGDFAPDVDATRYYNMNSNLATTVVYNPCIRIGDDFSDTFAEHPQTANIDAQTGAAPIEAPQTGITYKVDMDPNGQTVNGIHVSAGYLDTCFVRVPNIPENETLWTNDIDNQVSFGAHQDATFRWIMNELLVKYAAAEACPEEFVSLEIVKQAIKEMVLGHLADRYPNMATAFANAPWGIELKGPEERQAHHRDQQAATHALVTSMTRSFPNLNQNNETYPLAHPKIGDFAVYKCVLPNGSEFDMQVAS